MPEPDELSAWIDRARVETDRGERLRLPARDPLPVWTRAAAALGIAIGFFFGLTGGLASIALVTILAGALMVWRSTRWEIELAGAEILVHGALQTTRVREIGRIESGERGLRLVGDVTVDVPIETGPPGLAHALADHLRGGLQVAPSAGASGLDRWTRIRLDGAEIDLSPVDAPLPAWLVGLIAVGLGSFAFLPVLAEPALTSSPQAWLGALAVGALVAAVVAVAALMLQRPRCQAHVDGRRVRITRTRRFGERRTDIPLASIRSIEPDDRGVRFDTDAGLVVVPIPGRSRATRKALAERIRAQIATARDPGDARDVPAALQATRGATERG